MGLLAQYTTNVWTDYDLDEEQSERAAEVIEEAFEAGFEAAKNRILETLGSDYGLMFEFKS